MEKILTNDEIFIINARGTCLNFALETLSHPKSSQEIIKIAKVYEEYLTGTSQSSPELPLEGS
jgi:GTP-sensing pleiotropic transcriptional regulator CodY